MYIAVRLCQDSDLSKSLSAQPFRFEKELKDKLIQKSNAKLSEEACMIKMFKFFDVQDKGSVNFQEFCRVLEKLNMYYPPEQLKPLFDVYDSDKSGAVDYKEMTAVVLGAEVANKAFVKKNDRVEPQT